MTTMSYTRLLLLPIQKAWDAAIDLSWVKTALVFMLGAVEYLIHENLIGLSVLVGLVLVDQVTGVWVALRKRTLSSSAFRNGLIKLLFYCIIIATFHSLEYVNSAIFGFLSLDKAALMWLAMTEAISVVENSCTLLNIPFPNWLLDKLRVYVKFGEWKTKGMRRKSED
jgi:phage-related holin